MPRPDRAFVTTTAASLTLGCLVTLTAFAPVRAQPKFPTGSYVAGSLTLTFDENGTHSVSESDRVVVRGTYTVKGNEIVFTDNEGELACSETGRYQWQYDGKALTFKAVLDDCGGRVDGLTGQSWIRK